MLSSPLLIREYREEDALMVREIESKAARELTPLSRLVQYYEILPECFLVAEADRRVVGYVVANLHGAHGGVPEGHILSIAVHQAYRRNGVGRKLLAQVCNQLSALGACRVRLEVKSTNTVARQFYLREGFEDVGTVRGYYRGRGYSEDALVLIKQLHSL